MVSEGRVCCWPPRLVRGVPRLRVGAPLVVYPVALLNGGGGVCCDALSSDWVWRLALSCSPSRCRFPRIVLVPFLSCVAVFVVGGECGGGIVSRFLLLLPTVCVCCHSIVGLVLCIVSGLCHCGMAVVVCVG